MTAAWNLWASPIRFAATSYVLRVTANATTENLTFPASGSLDTESDYWMLDDGDTSDSLPKLLELCLESHSQIATATVEVDTTTSTISTRLNIVTDVSAQILWTHGSTTLDKDIFGFNAGTSGTDVDSNYMPQGLWRPRLGAFIDSRDRQPNAGGLTRALSGATRVVQNAVSPKERDIAYRYLHKSRALDEYVDALEPYNTFEKLRANAIVLGRPLRFCENEEIRTSPVEYRTRSIEDTLAIMSPPNLVWWECSLSLVRT